MQIFEGARSNEERDLPGERRLTELAQAVRQHEDTTRGQMAAPNRSQDRRLYTRLREICGEG